MSKIQKLDLKVSNRIRARRMLLGINQSELAEAASVSVQQIQKYERGKNRVSAGRLYELAKILRVPVQYFFLNINTEALDTNSLEEEGEDFLHSTAENPKNNEREIMSFIKVFCRIKCNKRKKIVIDLAKILAD